MTVEIRVRTLLDNFMANYTHFDIFYIFAEWVLGYSHFIEGTQGWISPSEFKKNYNQCLET